MWLAQGQIRLGYLTCKKLREKIEWNCVRSLQDIAAIMLQIKKRIRIAIELAEPYWLLKRKLVDEFRSMSLIFINAMQV